MNYKLESTKVSVSNDPGWTRPDRTGLDWTGLVRSGPDHVLVQFFDSLTDLRRMCLAHTQHITNENIVRE